MDPHSPTPKSPRLRTRPPQDIGAIQHFADLTLRRIIRAASDFPSLKRKHPSPTRARIPTVEVQLVSSTQIRILNRRYRKKDRPTDVLSFSSPGVFRKQGILGDLVIALPVARRQAREQGHTWQKELCVLLIHGYLHLLGFDHELGDREARTMARWESRLLEKLRARTKGLLTRAQIS